MPVKNSETPQKIYQLKVTLLRTSPPIWRRLLVPADFTLEQLHDVLQAAMGWKDCHMHDFSVGSQRFGKPFPDEEFGDGPVTASERTTRIFDVLRKVGAKAVYTYDFGDVGSMGLCWRRCWRPKQCAIIRRVLMASAMDHPKTAAVFGVFTTCWMRSAILSTTNTRKQANVWVTILTQRPFLSMMSTDGWLLCSKNETRLPPLRSEFETYSPDSSEREPRSS